MDKEKIGSLSTLYLCEWIASPFLYFALWSRFNSLSLHHFITFIFSCFFPPLPLKPKCDGSCAIPSNFVIMDNNILSYDDGSIFVNSKALLWIMPDPKISLEYLL